jgi:hypothetical protein
MISYPEFLSTCAANGHSITYTAHRIIHIADFSQDWLLLLLLLLLSHLPRRSACCSPVASTGLPVFFSFMEAAFFLS